MEPDKWGYRLMLRISKPAFQHSMHDFICKLRVRSISSFLQPVILFCTLLFTAQIQAEFLLGAKIADMKVDTPSSKNPINIAVDIGYELDSMLADLCLIAEINRTVISGETNLGSNLDIESEGVFLLWRTTRSLFVTLRGGVVQNKIIAGNTSVRGDGILLGASIGVVIGRTRLQIEYTSLAGDANFFGLGLEF